MTKNPGTRIDVASLVDEDILKLDLEAPNFEAEFSQDFMDAVRDSELTGNPLPTEYQATYDTMRNLQPAESSSWPNFAPQFTDYNPSDLVIQIVYIPIVIKASTFDRFNITHGLELYFRYLTA
jgi:hypothetical protein